MLLKKHGIAERGNFDENGFPCGWTIDSSLIADGKPEHIPVLTICLNGDVLVRGEYSEELTTERKNIMARKEPK